MISLGLVALILWSCSTGVYARGRSQTRIHIHSDEPFSTENVSASTTTQEPAPSNGSLRAEAPRRSLFEAQIVGGDPVGSQKYPFFVQSDATTSGFICGGSLVADDFVLTAAHCLNAYNGSERVLVGPYERESTDGPAQWRYRIGDLHVHAGFDMSHMRHDLMLFRIQPVSLANLRPIRFNLESDVPRTGQKLTAIGMGLNDDGVTSNALEGVTLTAVSDKQCYNEWSTNGDRQIDRKSMVCASTTGGKDVCNGDSGGPLLDSQRRLVGVVSFGPSNPCANPLISGVYARVSGARSWLKEILCKQSRDPPSDLCKSNSNNIGGGHNTGFAVPHRVVVQYGRWPQLLGWTVVEPAAPRKLGKTVAQVPRGRVRRRFARRQKRIRLKKGTWYKLVVRYGGRVAGRVPSSRPSGWVKLYRNGKLVRMIRIGRSGGVKVFKFLA